MGSLSKSAPRAIDWHARHRVVGLVVNVISMRLLSGGKETSLNVKGAYLEVWRDMLGSIDVIVGAILIAAAGVMGGDPIVAVAIG